MCHFNSPTGGCYGVSCKGLASVGLHEVWPNPEAPRGGSHLEHALTSFECSAQQATKSGLRAQR
jgi:hypothetical protein